MPVVCLPEHERRSISVTGKIPANYNQGLYCQ